VTLGKLCVIGGNSFIGKNLETDTKLSRQDCDLLDFDQTKLALKKVKPDSIINCAAKHGSVKEMSSNHVGYLEENLKISMNILRAAHELDINNVLLLGSVSSFPFERKNVISEEDFYLGPVNEVNFGYNSAKRMIVDLARTYQIDDNRNYKVAHLGNIYGPHMRFGENATLVGNLIHRINHALIHDIDLVLYGDGTDIRSLTYVKDLQEILFRFMKELSLRSHLIVSSGLEISIRELAILIAQIVGFRKEVIFLGEGNLRQRKVAVSGVLNSLSPNFEFTSLEKGLTATVDWFKQTQSRPGSVGRASLS
jgi:GDP-L-fucose synthase